MLETGRNADMAVHIVKEMYRNLYVKLYSSEHLYCNFYFCRYESNFCNKNIFTYIILSKKLHLYEY